MMRVGVIMLLLHSVLGKHIKVDLPDLVNLVPPETVDKLIVPSFLGRWYQMYTSLLPVLSFEKDGQCVTADYYDPSVSLKEISFHVVNSQTVGSPTGPLQQATGTATNNMPLLFPGKYRLSLTSSDVDAGTIDGFYWILETGDIEPGETQYPWAIVTTPGQVQLFVLSRDPDTFREKYKELVLQRLKDRNFVFPYNKPIETVHTPECNYVPEPTGEWMTGKDDGPPGEDTSEEGEEGLGKEGPGKEGPGKE
ncbi:hypothetical protein B484DRAFT_404554, partial [Ochromonadaceae sp. CCMP2298]